jgi:hypothetical protein
MWKSYPPDLWKSPLTWQFLPGCGKVIHLICGKLDVFQPDVYSVENLSTSNVDKLAVNDQNA